MVNYGCFFSQFSTSLSLKIIYVGEIGDCSKTRKRGKAQRDCLLSLSYIRRSFVATRGKFGYRGKGGQLWCV